MSARIPQRRRHVQAHLADLGAHRRGRTYACGRAGCDAGSGPMTTRRSWAKRSSRQVESLVEARFEPVAASHNPSVGGGGALQSTSIGTDQRRVAVAHEQAALKVLYLVIRDKQSKGKD